MSMTAIAIENTDARFEEIVQGPDFRIVAPMEVRSVAKRALDIFVAAVALVLLLPVILAVSLAVALSSPGGVFFTQERVGQGGKLFKVIKFRSMRPGTQDEMMSCPKQRAKYLANDYKMDAGDPRITGVGRFIRKTSLDELPQLFNVIKGDMSLVGIRPLLEPELGERLRYDQDCYRAMKPGMTGLWQVSGRSSVDQRDRHALDRSYAETWSMVSDLSILVRTPVAVLRTSSTQ